MEDQTYKGHKTQCDPALQVKASHGSMGQICVLWQAREIEPAPCTSSVPPQVPGSPGRHPGSMGKAQFSQIFQHQL